MWGWPHHLTGGACRAARHQPAGPPGFPCDLPHRETGPPHMLCPQSGHPSTGTDLTSEAPGGLPPPATSLDTHESTAPPVHGLYYRFRHSQWIRQREAVDRALATLLRPGLSASSTETKQEGATNGQYPSTLDRFRDCGTNAWVLRSPGPQSTYRLAVNRCRHRFCLPCQGERGRLIAANITENLSAARLRFATLTVRSRPEPLSDTLTHLILSFRRLRRSPLWRDHVVGGVAILEVSYNSSLQMWHPHLHCILEGNYLPQQALSSAWMAATGDSHIVDVRAVRRLADVASYLTAYLCKSIGTQVWRNHDRLCEAIVALHGRKTLISFGTWHRLHLLEPPTADGTWVPLCSADTLLFLARQGNTDALRICSWLWRKKFVHWHKEHPP